jgi:CHAT domain-containing protein/tetratricopeptide (TPR) repeat protein
MSHLKQIALKTAVICLLFFLILAHPASAQALPQESDPQQQATDLINTATQNFNNKEYQAALDEFTQALTLVRELKDRQAEAYCLYFIGASQYFLEDYASALAAYQQSQPIWHELGDQLWESITWNAIANLYSHLQLFDQAIPAYQKLLDLTIALGDTKRQAQTLYSLALANDLLSQYEQALQYYQKLLELQQKTDDQAGQAETLYNLGVDQSYLGMYGEALANLQQALALFQSLGDQAGELLTLTYTGSVLYRQGNYSDSRQYYQQGYSLAQSLGDSELELESLIATGLCDIRLNDYVNGIKEYNDALEITRQSGDLASQGTILNNLGLVYHYYLGQLTQALTYYQQALDLARQINDPGLEGLVLTNLATAYLDQDDLPNALNYYQQGLAAIQKTDSLHGIGTTLSDIGLVYQRMGETSLALDYYQQALEANRNAFDRREEAYVLGNIGIVYLNQDDLDQALAYEQQALAIQEDLDDRASLWSTLYAIAYIQNEKGETELAITTYKKAVDIAESVQKMAKIEEFRSAVASSQAPLYEELVSLLWKQGRYTEAFQYAERGRARAFLDQLANGNIDLRSSAPVELLEKEKALRNQISREREDLVSLRNSTGSSRDTESISEKSDTLLKLETEYQILLTEIKVNSPETAALVSVDTADLQDIQQLLPPQLTLIEYYITTDQTFIFVITRQEVTQISVQVNREDLANAVDSFRSFADLSNANPESLKQLYTWLIAPIKDNLKTPVIGIIPHSILHYLPFAALTDGKTYLSEKYTLFTLPSASSLRFLHPKVVEQPISLLALGNPTTMEQLPDLHYAEKEVQSIASLFKSQALIGTAATKSAFLEEARQATYIHLAAHGQFDISNPLFSTIFLAGDNQDNGRLAVYEIYGLDLTDRTDLVVLSACQSQVGHVTNGDEVVGLTRAFLYSGTPSVIASLWNVDDAATSLLMEKFYQHLQDGSSKAGALRQAQADVRKQYPNPYYWAAFVLTGDPGINSTLPGHWMGINSSNIGRVAATAFASLVLLLALSALAGMVIWLRKK